MERHGKGWRWTRMIQGERVRVPLQATTQEEAVAEALELEKRVVFGSVESWEREVERFLADAVAQGQLSARSVYVRRNLLLRFGAEAGVERVDGFTRATVERWLASQEQLSGATVATYQKWLRSFADWLVLKQRVYVSPLAGMPRKKGSGGERREVFLTSEEVGGLLAAAREQGNGELELILLLGFECGMRRGEIASARAEWVDLEKGLMRVPAMDGERFQRKGEEGRRRAVSIPMSGVVRGWFEDNGVGEPFLLRPEKAWGKSLYRYDFQKMYRTFMDGQGYGHVSIHDMRRSFGSNRVSAGVSLEKVANWLGIDVRTAWKHYVRFIPADGEIERGSVGEAVRSGIPAEPEGTGAGGRRPAREVLRELKELHEEGLIEEEEWREKRAEVLRGL